MGQTCDLFSLSHPLLCLHQEEPPEVYPQMRQVRGAGGRRAGGGGGAALGLCFRPDMLLLYPPPLLQATIGSGCRSYGALQTYACDKQARTGNCCAALQCRSNHMAGALAYS